MRKPVEQSGRQLFAARDLIPVSNPQVGTGYLEYEVVIECLEGAIDCPSLAGQRKGESDMHEMMDLKDVRWGRYPAVAGHGMARRWMETQVLLGMAPNTVDAYARGVEDFLGFSEMARILATEVTGAKIGTC